MTPSKAKVVRYGMKGTTHEIKKMGNYTWSQLNTFSSAEDIVKKEKITSLRLRENTWKSYFCQRTCIQNI